MVSSSIFTSFLLLKCAVAASQSTGVKIEHDDAIIQLGVKGDVSLERKGPQTLHINSNLSLPNLVNKTCVIQTGMQENGGVLLKETREGMTLLSCQERCAKGLDGDCAAFVHSGTICWQWKSIKGSKTASQKTKSLGICTSHKVDVASFLLNHESRISALEKLISGIEETSVKGKSKDNPAASCNEIKKLNSALPSGIYWITAGGFQPFQAYCDMATDEGGWTLVAVATYQNKGTSGWNSEAALNSALWTNKRPPQFWHFPSSYMNKLGNAYRMNCFDSNNNYKRYWWGVSDYKWTKITDATSCNTKYDATGTSYPTTWASHHWGLVCGNNEKEVVITSHSQNHWACAGNQGPGGEGYTGRNGKSNFELWIKDFELVKGSHKGNPAKSCQEIKSIAPKAKDGIYYISAGGETFKAYCDMTTDGGGWTLAGVSLFKDRGKSGWNSESSLRIVYSSFQKPPDSWHLSRASINALTTDGSTPNVRVRCFESNNNYVRYWWNVKDYQWTKVSSAQKCNDKYSGTGTSYSTTWAGHHWGLVCGNNEKVTVITSHSSNQWACAGNQGPGGEGYTGRGGKSNQRIWVR